MPASYCGLVGFKPSYGRCSRHGLIAYANSLDTVGILSKDIEQCANVYGKRKDSQCTTAYALLDIISSYDIQDPTSIPIDLRDKLDKNDTELAARYPSSDLKGLTVGIPQEFYVDSLSKQVIDVWRQGIQRLQHLGATIVSVSIPHVSLALPAYYIIALAEASSNLSRYDGIRYGK
jgi:aspartyl-tRNA(Asn)/glutamyl-tRNA(Gln) amidotransferase subunit A